MGWWERLKQGLQKTRQLLQTDIRDLFKSGEILTEEHLERFFAQLVRTDMGYQAAEQIVKDLRLHHLGRTVQLSELWQTVRTSLLQLVSEPQSSSPGTATPGPLRQAPHKPTIILIVGVNGTGKTTSIAKLAYWLQQQRHQVMVVAGDTFRAAAVEQLQKWCARLQCPLVTKPAGTDPAAVAYAGCEEALRLGIDYVLIDTAGRLHTQQNLMQELEKVQRVIGKKIAGAPHECLLVIDATTGQNGVQQARLFSKAVACTGIILTKLDGTAKGGVAIAIRKELGIPVKFVGVGEQLDDLQVFDSERFVAALLEL